MFTTKCLLSAYIIQLTAFIQFTFYLPPLLDGNYEFVLLSIKIYFCLK